MRMCLCTHADGLLVVIIWRILRIRRFLSLSLIIFFSRRTSISSHREIDKWDEMRNDVVSMTKESE